MSRLGRGRGKPFQGVGGASQDVFSETVHPSILKAARKSGVLNLSQRGLTKVPERVWTLMEDVPEEAKSISLDNTDDKWWEVTDLTKLILASNKLSTINEDIRKFEALTVLDVHDNCLTSLPKAIGALYNLQRLDLSHNQLSAIPDNIALLSMLVSLQVDHNCLTSVCEEVCGLKNLEILQFILNRRPLVDCYLYLNGCTLERHYSNVSYNQLESIPRYICLLSHLRNLNISNNRISSLPPDIGSLDALRIFDATHNKLVKLPDEFGQLSKLEQLHLQHNQLAYLPILRHCTNLKEILVGNNNIRGLSKEHLESMTTVTCLDIRDNKLQKIPDEIILMDQLERLILTNNDISALPYILGTMQNLKSIVLDGNPLRSIRRDIIMRGTVEIKKYLISRLSEEELQQQGPQVSKSNVSMPGSNQENIVNSHDLHQLKSLDYSGKKTDSIPDIDVSAALEAGVKTIKLDKNIFTDIPGNIAVLSATLKELSIGFNKISVLGAVVGIFNNLQMLDLRNNHLTDLPVEISALLGLRELILSNNRFKVIPSVVFNLEKLEILFAASNQITSLDPDGFANLKLLGTLDLQNNDISQVPPELGNCVWIKSLVLTGNPLRNPRPAILAKGTPAILEYLRGRIVS